jgi:hypothetical protein
MSENTQNNKFNLSSSEKKRKKIIIIFLFIIAILALLGIIGMILGKISFQDASNNETEIILSSDIPSIITDTPTQNNSPTITSTLGTRYVVMVELIENLYQQNVITTTNGEHHTAPNEKIQHSKLGECTWEDTGYKLTDFIISSEVTWDISKDNANMDDSGCGFVFRHRNSLNYYLIRLNLDGYVRLSRVVKGKLTILGSQYYQPLSIHKGKAKFNLVVEGTHIRFYINDNLVLYRTDQRLYNGDLSLATCSGTNKDPGMTCNFQKINIWELPYEPPTPSLPVPTSTQTSTITPEEDDEYQDYEVQSMGTPSP